MSRRNKLQKFADLQQLDNVYENFTMESPQLVKHGHVPVDLKGQWRANHFGNLHPITLELGCGKGDYTVELARTFPQRNFIGVDVKGARIWKGATRSASEGISNAAFLRTRIECIEEFFEEAEVSEIWITFPDPFPRDSKVNRRLTAPMFLDRYRKILQKGGVLHLKTDDDGLYQFTREVIDEDPRCELVHGSDNIYSAPRPDAALEIKTYYEIKHLAEGKTIKYLKFRIH